MRDISICSVGNTEGSRNQNRQNLWAEAEEETKRACLDKHTCP